MPAKIGILGMDFVFRELQMLWCFKDCEHVANLGYKETAGAAQEASPTQCCPKKASNDDQRNPQVHPEKLLRATDISTNIAVKLRKTSALLYSAGVKFVLMPGYDLPYRLNSLIRL